MRIRNRSLNVFIIGNLKVLTFKLRPCSKFGQFRTMITFDSPASYCRWLALFCITTVTTLPT